MIEVFAPQESAWIFPENNGVRHREDTKQKQTKTKTILSLALENQRFLGFFLFLILFWNNFGQRNVAASSNVIKGHDHHIIIRGRRLTS